MSANAAHSDNENQVFSVIGVQGTLGTADTKGTASTLPIGVDPSTGAAYVYNLGPAGSVTMGNIPGGTLNYIGTLAGTSLVRILDATGADLDLFKQGDNFATGSDHGLSILGLSDGTPKKYSFIRVEGVDADGEASLTEGALSAESYSMYYNGSTWDRVRGDGTSGAYSQIIKGTINAATTRSDARTTQNILTYGTTFGGTAAGYGTLVGSAAVGAGTSVWVNDISIVNQAGTVGALLGFGTALNGTSVLAKGKFAANGGIQKSFPRAVNAGMTNQDLVCYIDGAGTIDVNVSYFISA